MNLGEIRQKVADLRSRHIAGNTFANEFKRSVITPALKQLASEVPEAFIPDEEVIVVYQDYTSTGMNRTISATKDEFVLDLGTAALPGATPIVVNGTWDAIYHLEVTDSTTGQLIRRRCREFFIEPSTGHAMVSIDRPWRNNTDTGLDFRLYQPYFYTRDDVTALVDGRVYDSTQQVLFTVPAGAMRVFQQEDFNGTVTGRPERLSRWGHEQIPAPNRPPVGSVTENVWLGPEPPGTFKYRYTYVWGRKDSDLKAPGGFYDPMLESSPSPETSAVVVPSAAASAEVTGLVNIDYVQGFDPEPAVSYFRNGHSGWRKRIYRARSAVVAAPGFKNNIEYPEDVYFFLDEVEGTTTSYLDRGEKTPDYSRRMPESHGYFRWALHPHQNDNYTVDFRVYRRPLPLLNDNDAPQVHTEYEDMLLLLCLKYAAMLDKQPAEASDYEAQFKDKVAKWRAKDANPASVIIPLPWTMVDYADWYRYGPFKSVVP